MLCLSGGVGVDVHSRINIRVPLQLLRTFGNRAIGEKTTGEGGGDAACGNGSPSDLEPFLWLSGISGRHCWGIQWPRQDRDIQKFISSVAYALGSI